MQTLAQVLPRHATYGQWAAPEVSSVRQPVSEESRTNRQSSAQCRRRGGQAVALPEDIATGLLKAVHGREHNIGALVNQQLAPLGHQAPPYRHEPVTSTVVPPIRGKIANVPSARSRADDCLGNTEHVVADTQ